MSDRNSDIDIKATITTVADNTGADQARQAITDLAQTTQAVTDQQAAGARQSRDDSAAQTAAIGSVARATETLSGTYAGLGDKTAAVNKGTREFSTTTTATSAQYEAALVRMGGKMDALKGKTKATTAATKELGQTAADAAEQNADASAAMDDSALKLQQSLNLVQRQQGAATQKTATATNSISKSMGSAFKYSRQAFSMFGKVMGSISRLVGYLGLLDVAYKGSEAAWRYLDGSAGAAAENRKKDIALLNKQLTEQKQLLRDLALQETNRNAQKNNLGTLQLEVDLMTRRNAEMEKTTRLQNEAAEYSTRIANDKIELQRLDLARKLQEKLIDEIEYKKQDIALLKQQAALTRDLADARAKANLESAKSQQQSAGKTFSEALTQQRNTSDPDILDPEELKRKQDAKAMIEADHGRIYTEISSLLRGMDAYRMSPQEIINHLQEAIGPAAIQGQESNVIKINELIEWVRTRKDAETTQKENLSSDIQKHEVGLLGLGYTPDNEGLVAYQAQREQQAANVKAAHDELSTATDKVTESEKSLARTREENALISKKEDKQTDNELADLTAKKELELKERSMANTTSKLAEQIDILKNKMETASNAVKSAQTEGRNRMDRLQGKNNPQLNDAIKNLDLENILTQSTLAETQAKKLTDAKKILSESKWKDEQARKDLLDMITQILAAYKANAAALKDKPKLDALIKLQTQTSRYNEAKDRKDLTKEVYEKVKKSIAEDMEKAEKAKTQSYNEDRNIAVTLNKTKEVLSDGKIEQQEKQALLNMLQQWQAYQQAGNNSEATGAIIAALQNILTNFTSSADAFKQAVTTVNLLEKKFAAVDKDLRYVKSQLSHQS